MNSLYRSIGISKQGFHQHLNRELRALSEKKQLLMIIYNIRQDHPTMGIRDMYFKIQPSSMGRDAFELFCKEEQLNIERFKNYKRTTDSYGVNRFTNHTIDLEITHINQVWQSDITYYELQGRFYYLTFIIDGYSRRIVGHHTSSRLTTEQTTLPALKIAINLRKKENQEISGLIFHSDGGGQYYDEAFKKLTAKNKMTNSMCEYPWENGKAERINGIIKNNYLKYRKINNFDELVKEVDRTVQLYNNDKPHSRLKRITPINFEKLYICKGQKTDGDKSTTELKTQPEGLYSPSGSGQKTSESNITLELKIT